MSQPVKPVLLFLDHDGVLETPSAENFVPMANLPLLEQTVLETEHLYVVLSTPTREDSPLEDLVRDFSMAFRERIIGVLPCLPVGRADGGREAEAQSWMQAHSLPSAQWLALDDESRLWKTSERLIDVDPLVGYDQEARARLLAAIAIWRQGESEATTGMDRSVVGARQVLGTVSAWHDSIETGFFRLEGRADPYGFKRRVWQGTEEPRVGQAVRAWLARDNTVLRVADAAVEPGPATRG